MLDSKATLLFGVLLYLFTDSLLAFKSLILYTFGLYIMIFLKIMYNSPRPFWVNSEVNTFNGACKFDFASPSVHIFSVIFFWSYNIFNYQVKYVRETNRKLVTFLIILVACVTITNLIIMMLFGLLYIYQGVITFLYSLTYLVFCINFENEIFNLCEKIGFIIRTSRRFKFHLMFICIGLLLLQLLISSTQQDGSQWQN